MYAKVIFALMNNFIIFWSLIQLFYLAGMGYQQQQVQY